MYRRMVCFAILALFAFSCATMVRKTDELKKSINQNIKVLAKNKRSVDKSNLEVNTVYTLMEKNGSLPSYPGIIQAWNDYQVRYTAYTDKSVKTIDTAEQIRAIAVKKKTIRTDEPEWKELEFLIKKIKVDGKELSGKGEELKTGFSILARQYAKAGVKKSTPEQLKKRVLTVHNQVIKNMNTLNTNIKAVRRQFETARKNPSMTEKINRAQVVLGDIEKEEATALVVNEEFLAKYSDSEPFFAAYMGTYVVPGDPVFEQVNELSKISGRIGAEASKINKLIGQFNAIFKKKKKK